ncbi:hypothetical protein QM012_006632 [Aureobasidium pullulans]|uniref:SERTA domain-containing protein n=1 Tax=Aureobasidium pullulans TaxID=5580 RepID=A0ABR0TPE8_AURPU
MLSTAAAADAPLSGFERKLSSSIQRLRANSIHHERTSKSSESSKSQLYLHRLKSINRRGGHDLSNDEALFFLSLPDKIRRLHFTAEENILMRAACELKLSRRPRYDSLRPLPLRSWTDGDASSSHSYASSSNSRHTMAGPTSLPSTPITSDGGYPSVTSSRTSSRPRTESTVSSNASVRPFNPLGCHPLGGSRATIMTQSPFDYTKVATKVPETPSSTTRQYLDPKTRMMIRQCTASPEAFDEVVNFGYQTEEDYPATDSPTTPGFQFDEGLSSSDGISDEDEDYFTLDSDDEPWTPGSDDTLATSWDMHSPTYSPVQRYDSSCYRPKQRPMTLRVTLTKPENKVLDDSPVRAAKPAQPYRPSLRVVDPLALEQLTFSDDVTGKYGAFAVTPTKDSSKMKKLLKRLTSPAF